MSESPKSDDGYQSHYNESYAYQESKGQDNYGQPTYTAYASRYAGQGPPGRDRYGNPTYNNWYNVIIFIVLWFIKRTFLIDS